ncbi:MAG: 2-C-methyl-D-erythritol 2,4-cyclodiphosphate synthase [Urechidicola sp.]|jgi:2-C-methyl-D-erythritol 2,4-cyclodiphosphate synthase|tara:strand:+ start:5759 stop:6235 length:477 start_codon:yes stop_codon:yes gene_type:complete
MNIRTGIGFDVHQLVEGEEFWLGGILLDYHKGGLGHSDADVLLHAICDALLGAANLGDIGKHFPDTSADYKGIDSKILLKRVSELISEKDYKISNIDSTICLQKPKLAPHLDTMKGVIAKVLGLAIDQVSIKATTTEKLGFVGREEGISAYSSVLIFK